MMRRRQCSLWLCLLALLPVQAVAHELGGADAGFVASNQGAAIAPYIYLGAKHMLTGYDHLLFLAGVIFFLRRGTDVIRYVSLFALGHSLTLIIGVLAGIRANIYLIDAIIALSVIYKALENMGGLDALGRFKPNTQLAVFVFGLFHGFGLASSVQALEPARDGLLINLLSFNIGVESGQLLALMVMLAIFGLWRRQRGFERHAVAANAVLMCAGVVVLIYQLTAWQLAA